MAFPQLSPEQREDRLTPPEGKVQMILDTDTYNEVDDQFALVHALRSPESMEVRGVHAAPFHNARSADPGDGMAKSYDEILRLLDLMDIDPGGLVYRGATGYLPDADTPVGSAAAEHLVDVAMAATDAPLYVVAIGAITNVASALLMEPRIAERIVVVWLGGNDRHYPHAHEFNLKQDVPATRVVFDCGVPLVHIPCKRVASHLLTTLPELRHYLAGGSKLGDYLYNIVDDYGGGDCWSKVIWDISATSWLVNHDWVRSSLAPSPVLTAAPDGTLRWQMDPSRHLIREAFFIDRDAIFRDVFTKITSK